MVNFNSGALAFNRLIVPQYNKAQQKKTQIRQHAPVFFCRTGICQTQDIFLSEIGTKIIFTFLVLV